MRSLLYGGWDFYDIGVGLLAIAIVGTVSMTLALTALGSPEAGLRASRPTSCATFDYDRRFEFAVSPETFWTTVSRTESYPNWWTWLREFRSDGLHDGGAHRMRDPCAAAVRAARHGRRRTGGPARAGGDPRPGDLEGPARLEITPTPSGCAARLVWSLELRSRGWRDSLAPRVRSSPGRTIGSSAAACASSNGSRSATPPRPADHRADERRTRRDRRPAGPSVAGRGFGASGEPARRGRARRWRGRPARPTRLSAGGGEPPARRPTRGRSPR